VKRSGSGGKIRPLAAPLRPSDPVLRKRYIRFAARAVFVWCRGLPDVKTKQTLQTKVITVQLTSGQWYCNFDATRPSSVVNQPAHRFEAYR